MKKFIAFALLIALLAFLAFKYFNRISLEVSLPVRGTAVKAVYATGTIEAKVMVPLVSRLTAKLVELNVDEGDKVKKGDLLAKFEDIDLLSNLSQLQAQEKLTKKIYDRNSELIKTGSISIESFENSKAGWESANAMVNKAIAEANFTKIIAPADGEIIKRDGEIGQLLTPQQPLFWMKSSESLRIVTEVNEEDISLVKIGQNVLIRADAFPDKIFNGKVQAITPKGDPVARTYRVRVEFIEDVPLQIGMTAETNIIISKKENALLVPSSAVTENNLWIVDKGKLINQKVKLGIKGLNQIEILDGVREDSNIVVYPTFKLAPNIYVNTFTNSGTK
jgi:membrane fusion protein, multidrug efflux system